MSIYLGNTKLSGGGTNIITESGSGLDKYSDSSVYSTNDTVWFEDDDKIYVWVSITDSVAGNSPSDDTTNWNVLSETSLSDLGITATTTEINVLDGLTATTDELNVLDGLTATTTELNTLDGVTATASEINKLTSLSGNLITSIGENIFGSPSSNSRIEWDETNSRLQWVSAGSQSGHQIQDDGTDVTTRSNLNFQSPLTVTDDSANDATVIDITLTDSDIPDLNASKITAGTLDDARIPTVEATDKLSSAVDGTNATDGHVLTADGSGGVAWEAVSGGGGGGDTEETGTWTPNAGFFNHGASDFVNKSASYIKQGSLVYCHGRVGIPSNTDTDHFTIEADSLPFTLVTGSLRGGITAYDATSNNETVPNNKVSSNSTFYERRLSSNTYIEVIDNGDFEYNDWANRTVWFSFIYATTE